MNRLLCIIGSFVIIGASFFCPARAADDGDQILAKSAAKGIADNIDAYLDDPADPVIIYLDLCGSFDSLKNITSGNIRADLPDLPSTPRRSASNQKPSSIALSKAVLRCLKIAAATPGFPSSDPVKVSARCQ